MQGALAGLRGRLRTERMVGLAWEPWRPPISKYFPLGLPVPLSQGLLTHWKAPGQRQPRRKAANTVAKGNQLDRECASSPSAQLGGKAQATSKAWHWLCREGPFREVPSLPAVPRPTSNQSGQPGLQLACHCGLQLACSQWTEQCSPLPAAPRDVIALRTPY